MEIEHSLNEVEFRFLKACKDGNADLILDLLDTIKCNWDFNQGLLNACERGHVEIAKMMIELGSDNINDGLINAAVNGHLLLVIVMINHGANNIKDILDNYVLNNEIESYFENYLNN